MKHFFFFICCLFFASFCFSQPSKIDSLLSLLKKDKEDTSKVIHLNKLCDEYRETDSNDTALYYSNMALQLSWKINYTKGIGNTYNRIGLIYEDKTDFTKALENYFKALKISEESKNKKLIAIVLGNIGIVYRNQSDYPKALDYYFKALKMKEELGNKREIAITLGNIGNVYWDQLDYAKALDYDFKALKIREELRDKNLIAATLGNIGIIYHERHDYPKALDYFFKALKMKEELGNKNGIAIVLGNIGVVYKEQAINSKSQINKDSLFKKALDIFFKTLKMRRELGAKVLIASCLDNIGSLYTETKQYKEAENYLLDALTMDKEIGDLNGEKDDENDLTELYSRTNRYQLALEHYKKATVLKDSIFNEEKNKEITRKEMNYEFEKKEAVTKAEHDAETKQQKIVIWSVIGGLLLVVVFTGFIFRSLRVTRKQKTIIEEQKQLVEEHQKDIIDSITYAKRLQEAILPPLDFVKKHLPESFILYKPKDIVAGDFYWMYLTPNPSPAGEGNAESGGEVIFIAACDCTGHGVPGAMVSVVCSNALNRTVKEFGLRDTGKILDKVTELVVETFEKSDKDVKDGMDISLMAINKSTKQIFWSGANNPLLYIQNNELIDITADKQPIGKHDNRKPFSSHAITLQTNATFYLFTDGFADQFGGPKGKKFKYKQFEEKLLAISTQPMEEQKKSLEQAFDNWKGSVEQVDDVLVIGIKI